MTVLRYRFDSMNNQSVNPGKDAGNGLALSYSFS